MITAGGRNTEYGTLASLTPREQQQQQQRVFRGRGRAGMSFRNIQQVNQNAEMVSPIHPFSAGTQAGGLDGATAGGVACA